MRIQHARWWLVLPLFYVALAGAREPNAQQPERLERLWDDLGGANAAKAYQAIVRFGLTPRETAAFIKAHLRPAAAPDSAKVKEWIAGLSSSNYSVRTKANAELQKLAELVEPSLQSAVRDAPSVEARRRVEALLGKLQGPIVTQPAELRALRAVEALERIDHDDARELLRSYAAGAPAGRLTQAAAAALERLARRPAETLTKKPIVDRYGDPLPAGAVARLGTVRFRRGAIGLAGIAFLPDGKTLLTVGGHDFTGQQQGMIQVWDVATGRLQRELETGFLAMWSFALAPGGTQFALAGQRQSGALEIRVFDLVSGKAVKEFARKGLGALEFSPDGKRLFSLSPGEGLLRIDDIASGKELRTKTIPADANGYNALSVDGTQVAISIGDHLVLWNWQTDESRTLNQPPRAARDQSITFSPDGKLLAGFANDTFRRLCVWDVPTGRLLYQHESPGKYYWNGKPVFTPDGKTLVVPAATVGKQYGGAIHLLDPRTGTLQGTLGGTGYFVAVSADSRRLATAGDSRVRVWDLASRAELMANDEAHWLPVMRVHVSSTGLVATAAADESARLWDGATGEQRRKFSLPGQIPLAVRFSPDGKLLVASSLDDTMPVWDTRTGREIYRLAGHGRHAGSNAVSFLPDGRRFLSWGDDGYLRLWDTKNGKALFEHALGSDAIPARFPPLDFGQAIITPDGKTLIGGAGGRFQLIDIASGKEKQRIAGESADLFPLAVSPDSKYFLAMPMAEEPQATILMEVATGKAVQHFSVTTSYVGLAAFSPDGRTFAIAPGEKRDEILIYEMASGQLRCTVQGIRGPMQCMAFFPDSRRLAVALNDSTVVVWDLMSVGGR